MKSAMMEDEVNQDDPPDPIVKLYVSIGPAGNFESFATQVNLEERVEDIFLREAYLRSIYVPQILNGM